MKILVVGDGHSSIHEVAVAAAFEQLGHEVQAFYWHGYFKSRNPLKRLWLRAQNKFLIGPVVSQINSDLLNQAIKYCPTLIFIYRGTHIGSQTIAALKHALSDCHVFGYNNDDPFADGHPPWLWRHFIKGIPAYDLMFAYRKHNIAEYYNYGAKKAELLMSWFLPDKHKPPEEDESCVKQFDIVFVGHYEDDARMCYLRKIAESDCSFGLFGPDWHRVRQYDWLSRYQPILPVVGNFYRSTILSAKITLCFLSTLNRDTYTRRCFEIPAMGAFMLCQYSEDLTTLFDDGVDVVLFHNPEDMIDKIRYYLENDDLRERIAKNGRNRVIRDKHDVVSRMKYVLSFCTAEGFLECK